MPFVLDETWAGRRVVLRRAVDSGPDGRPQFSDALGDLVELSDAEAVVETRSGVIRMPRSEINTARLVLPAPLDQYALEATAARGWRAIDVETSDDGWLLRADGGWTGRANSALPLRTLTRPLDEALSEVSDWYARRGLPAMIQVPLPAASSLDTALARRGWTVPEEVFVLVARLDLLRTALTARPIPAGVVATIAPRPDDAWLTSYHYRGGELPGNAAALLGRHDRVGFATVRDRSGAVLATARGAVDDGWLGITAVEVDPAHRRRGAAGAVMAALVGWARMNGAARCYLQVSDSNAAALSLYRRLGFWEHHSYHYRLPPTIEA